MSNVWAAYQLVYLLRRYPIKTLDVSRRWMLFCGIMVFPFLPLLTGWIAFRMFGPHPEGLPASIGILVGIVIWVGLLRLWADRGYHRHHARVAAVAKIAGQLYPE